MLITICLWPSRLDPEEQYGAEPLDEVEQFISDNVACLVKELARVGVPRPFIRTR